MTYTPLWKYDSWVCSLRLIILKCNLPGKWPVMQAWRLGAIYIALLFLLTRTLIGGGRLTPHPGLLPQGWPYTRWIGGWVSPRAGMDGCGKYRLHRDSIPEPSSPWRVDIPSPPDVRVCSLRICSYRSIDQQFVINDSSTGVFD